MLKFMSIVSFMPVEQSRCDFLCVTIISHTPRNSCHIPDGYHHLILHTSHLRIICKHFLHCTFTQHLTDWDKRDCLFGIIRWPLTYFSPSFPFPVPFMLQLQTVNQLLWTRTSHWTFDQLCHSSSAGYSFDSGWHQMFNNA